MSDLSWLTDEQMARLRPYFLGKPLQSMPDRLLLRHRSRSHCHLL